MTRLRCFHFEHAFDSRTGGPCCYLEIPGARTTDLMRSHPIYQEIKQQFDRGSWHEDYCQRCRTIEQAQIPGSTALSKRQSVASWPDRPGVPAGALRMLTVDTGRLCNIQCRSCNPYLSSSWIDEYNKMPLELKRSNHHSISLKVWPHNAYDYTDEDFSNLEFVDLLGGEPMYNTEAFGIVQRILEATKGDCTLCFTTNATIRLDIDRHKWLKEFRQIHLILSIDAVGPAAEFIRTGCRWETVERNIDHYISMPNVQIEYHPTYSVLNLFEINALRKWMTKAGIGATPETTYVEHPAYLSYDILDDDERAIVVDYLRSHEIDDICDMVSRGVYQADLRSKFHTFMTHTKRYHQLDWGECLPELYSLLNRS